MVRFGGQKKRGIVFMNRAYCVDPDLCWTGCEDTGRGRGRSEIGFHSLT